jgi:hypothetical protein
MKKNGIPKFLKLIDNVATLYYIFKQFPVYIQ